jgi:hypothetical protein
VRRVVGGFVMSAAIAATLASHSGLCANGCGDGGAM